MAIHDILLAYPKLASLNGVKSFTAFNEANRHGIPFPPIQSHLVSATILAYYGSVGTSVDLCQRLSEQSRAYIVRQDFLPGFLVPNVTAWLTSLKKTGQIESVYNIKSLPDTFFKDFKELKTSIERQHYLLRHNKRLYGEALRITNRLKERQVFYEEKMTEPEDMSVMIADYLKPLIFDLRRDGKLVKRKYTNKEKEEDGTTYEYDGEVLEQGGEMTGFGRFSRGNVYSEGTFYHGRSWGITVRPQSKARNYYEAYKGNRHGKATCYWQDGRIGNFLYKNGEEVAAKEITDTPEHAFYKEFDVLRALDEDWKNYI